MKYPSGEKILVTAEIIEAKKFVVFRLEIVAEAIVAVARVAVPFSARSFAAMSPVAVRLVTVVEARVDDPVTRRLAEVVVAATRRVVVALVIVPLVALILAGLKLVTERLVIVAEVRVALVPIRLVRSVLPVRVVEARVADVVAVSTPKVAVLPKVVEANRLVTLDVVALVVVA